MASLMACVPLRNEVAARAATDLACVDQPIEATYLGSERYVARGCGKAATFRCTRRLTDDVASCTLVEGSMVAVDVQYGALASRDIVVPEPASPGSPDPHACEAAAKYDRRARWTGSPAKEQLERIAATKHRECDALTAAPAEKPQISATTSTPAPIPAQ
jgi:hypothetical protein